MDAKTAKYLKKVTRIPLDLSPEMYILLENLQAAHYGASKAEVIRHALRLMATITTLSADTRAAITAVLETATPRKL